ncbi:glycoside hydrolase family 19 protein [Thaumasiovibrio subtropicus]|uniref:glycoside hydrolase family 19 protein n=1 Tax=Thaumasiovibrio subtropicus TaxID=1891207 RepID=UPI000B34ABB2|nr:glycoside hydrolase family 19 protein [Thaumasiovibrio subtropicus]
MFRFGSALNSAFVVSAIGMSVSAFASYPNYSDSAVYVGGDQVVYQGDVYRAKWWTQYEPPVSENPTGVWEYVGANVPPSEPPIEPPIYLPPESAPAYDDSKVYVAGDRVYYESSIYEAKWWTQGEAPNAENGTGVWDHKGDGSDGGDGSTPPPEDSDNGIIGQNPDGSYIMSAEFLANKEAELTDSPEFDAVRASIATRDNAIVEAVRPGAAGNPENVRRVEEMIDQSKWDYLFPERDAAYTYENFLKAIAKFEGFCATYTDERAAESDAICAKSLAVMFAHFTQETGAHNPHSPNEEWRQGLYFVREAGCGDDPNSCGYNSECAVDNWQTQAWPCGTTPEGHYVKYFGRGAKQLSYHYNYGPFSDFIFNDVKVLLEDPEQVADSWLNLASAIFFFVYPQPPKPSMLHVIDGTWQPTEQDIAEKRVPGFGVTTMIINGGIECTEEQEKPQSVNRIKYYRGHAAALSVEIPADEQLGCAGMKPFRNQGDTGFGLYWENDWSYVADNPEGASFACKIVSGYQTAHTTLKEGDYAKCVQEYYGVTVE